MPPAIVVASVVDAADGSEINYVAPTSTCGETFLSYEIYDSTASCDTAKVTVTVLAESNCTILDTQGGDTLFELQESM